MRYLRWLLCACAVLFSFHGFSAAADLSAPELDINAGAGSHQAAVGSTTVTNNGTVNHQVGITLSSGNCNFTKFSPSSGTITANGGTLNISVTADVSKMNPGSCSGTLHVNTTGQTLDITVKVTTSGVILSVTNGGPFDTTASFPQTVTINTNTGVAINVTQGASWLSTSVPSVANGGQFKIQVNKSGLAPNNYMGQIQLTYNNTGSPFVDVFIGVTISVPGITTTSGASYTFQRDAGSSAITQGVSVSNLASSGILVTAVSSDISWLTVSPGSFTIPGNGSQTFTLTMDPGNKQPNTYNGTVKVSDGNTTLTFSVTLTVTGATVSVAAAPGAFSLAAGKTTSAQLIVNAGGATLNATASSSPPGWISTDNGTPSGAQQVTYKVNIDATGLSTAGKYSGQILITCVNQPACVPLMVPITLNLTAGLPSLTTSDNTNLSYTQNADSSVSPSSLQVHVAASDGSSLGFTTSVSPGGSWISASADHSSTPATITIKTTGTLPAQNATGAVTLTPPSSNGTSPLVINVSFTPYNTVPVISSVQTIAGDSNTLAQNTWIYIKGTNLAQTARNIDDFGSGTLPTLEDGVSVIVNNKNAFILYISDTQINVLTPVDSSTGPVQVQVKNQLGTSAAVTLNMAKYAPGFFHEYVAGNKYPAAQHASDYSLLGPVNMIPGVSSTPAKPNEEVIFYLSGYGQIDPPFVNGSPTQSGPLPMPWPVVTIGTQQANVVYAGVIAPGLYQFNVIVPAGAPDGELALSASWNGFTTQAGLVLAVQH